MGAQGGRALPEKRCNRFQSMWALRHLCLRRMDERATSDHTRRLQGCAGKPNTRPGATDPACCLQACVGKVNTRLGGDGPCMFLARLCREGQRQCSVEYQLNIS